MPTLPPVANEKERSCFHSPAMAAAVASPAAYATSPTASPSSASPGSRTPTNPHAADKPSRRRAALQRVRAHGVEKARAARLPVLPLVRHALAQLVQLGHHRLEYRVVAGQRRRRPAQRLLARVEDPRGLVVGAALGRLPRQSHVLRRRHAEELPLDLHAPRHVRRLEGPQDLVVAVSTRRRQVSGCPRSTGCASPRLRRAHRRRPSLHRPEICLSRCGRP